DRDPELFMLLGNLLREAERPDEAVASYQKASESSPYDMQLHLTLFGTYLAMGREEEAVAEPVRLQELQALIEARVRVKPVLLQEAERPDEAVASYQKASELSPYDMQLHLTLFGTYLDMGREEEAEAERVRLQEIQALFEERERVQQEMLQQLQDQEAEETPD